jgi:hypothetical protein
MKNKVIDLALPCLLLFFYGCSTPTHLPQIQNIGNGLARVSGDIDTASNSVNAAVPFTSDVGAAHLSSASYSLTDAKSQIVSTQKSLADEQKATDKIIKDDQQAHTDLSNERNHWIGYKTRLLARWIIGISLAVWLAVGILYAITSVSPIAWLSPIILEIERFLPAMNPFEWLASWLKSRKANPTASASAV